VSEFGNGEALANRRTTVIVVRLVLDDRGTLSHGEIVDEAGQVCARFVDWDALVPAVQTWLRRESRHNG
jgi:hypothetical protein